MVNYNIFSELSKDLAEFDEKKINIVNPKDSNDIRFGRKSESGYQFSQKEALETIDMMYNSKYKTGVNDREGQRKTYMNIVKFYSEVSRMQTDMDIKDFVFIPDSYQDIDKVTLLKQQFKVWSRENEYGQIINDLNTDYSKYGTCVAKRVGDTIERVRLHDLKNTQNAKTLKEAMIKGFVIQEHEYNQYELDKYTEWDTEGIKLDHDEVVKCYERYSLVPRSVIDEFNGEESKDEELVLAMQILAPEVHKEGETPNGTILYIEEIDEDDFPYEEAHWDKIDGRWLGVGEVENQYENQISTNLSANLRRRAMLWGAKKIFQTKGDAVTKNLIKEVADGQVLEVGKNGEISQIATESRHLNEFQLDTNEWNENSKQKSFAFEVSTGESMPSGTPFRLGVILSRSVQSHFGLKRENFGFFLKRAFFNQLIPIFKKQTGDHIVRLAQNEEGINRIFDSLLIVKTNELFMKKLLDDDIQRNLETLEFDYDSVKAEVEKELIKSPYFFVEVPDKFYDDVHFYLELAITGESSNTQEEVETLVNVWQTLSQKGDPRADRLLEVIIAKTGKNLSSIIGKAPEQAAQPLPQGGELAQLQGLANQGQNEQGTV